jgi:hypothetical protein
MMQLGQSMADNCERARACVLCEHRGIRYQLVPARAINHKKEYIATPQQYLPNLKIPSSTHFPAEGKSSDLSFAFTRRRARQMPIVYDNRAWNNYRDKSR